MTATPAAPAVGYADLLRDVRHLDARAASDLADWLAYLKVDGKADRTLYSYTRELAALLREVPDKTLQEIDAADINYVLSLKPERSRYITRSIFNAFFQWAVDDERLDRNPMVGKVPRMRQPKRRPKDIFSEVEVELLSRDPLLRLMFLTGLRKSECTHLRRGDIDLARARLVVYHGKGDKDRVIPLPMTALQTVADLDLEHRLHADEYVWALVRSEANRTGWWMRKPIGGTTFERWYRGTVERLGVRYLNPHQVRHTYGHRLRELGFDIEERQLLMGHESIRTTQHYYGRLTVEDVAAKMAEAAL